MHARWMGVALSVMMACLGTAEAAPLVAESLTISTTEGAFSVRSLPMEYSDAFTGQVTGFKHPGTASVSYDPLYNDLSIGIFASEYIYTYCDFPQHQSSGGCGPVTLNLLSQLEVHPTESIMSASSFDLSPVDLKSLSGYILFGQDGYDTGTVHSLTITGVSFTVVQTPLPASAPMFGAALLGVASVGFCMDRRRRSATAS